MENNLPKPRRFISRVRIHWGRVMVFSIVVFLLFEVALAFGRKIIEERQVHKKLLQTQQELQALRAENLQLKQEEEALYTPEKIEELARQKLDLVKPGEIAVEVIQNNKNLTNFSYSEKGKGENSSKNFWKKEWDKAKEEWPLKWLLKLGQL
jgi:cell division protein FtsL